MHEHATQSTQERRFHRDEITKAILLTVGLTGLFVLGAAAPGVFQAVRLFAPNRYRSGSVRKAVYRLDEKDWIVLKERKQGWQVELTKKGRIAYDAYAFGLKQLRKPKKWDGKWHMIIFDIPEKKRFIRDQAREFLKRLGFIRLQDSAWVFPYPCEEVLGLLRTRYHIRHEALYCRLDHIDQDRWLRQEFGLPKSETKTHGREF